MHAHTWMDLVSARGKCETCASEAGGQERKERTEEENPFSHAHLRHLLDPPAVPIEISNGMPPLTDLIKSNFLVR